MRPVFFSRYSVLPQIAEHFITSTLWRCFAFQKTLMGPILQERRVKKIHRVRDERRPKIEKGQRATKGKGEGSEEK